MEPGRISNAYDQTLWADEAYNGLPPRFRPCGVQESIAFGFKFRRLGSDIHDFELKIRLRDWQMTRPLVRAEAGLGSIPQGPQTKVLSARHFL